MKRFLLIITSLICANTSNGQLLWKVSEGELSKPSYIFGTYHVAPVSFCDSIQGFEQAFTRCEQLYGEVTMDNSTLPAVQEKMLQVMMAHPDSLLNTFYTEQQYRLIDETLKEHLGIGAEQVKMLKPRAVSSMLAVVVAGEYFPGFDPQKPIDVMLQERAINEGKAIGGFETIEFQTDLLFGIPLKEQAEELLKEIEKDYPELSKKMTDLYLNQDIESLLKIMAEDEYGYSDEYMKKLIFNRNRNWAEQLPSIMSEKPTFVVVGAGHLPGKEGLLNLLRGKGYIVEPVM